MATSDAGPLPRPTRTSFPSPTLTNPDMVLPDGFVGNSFSSPSQINRPPSPPYTYEQDQTRERQTRENQHGLRQAKTLGLMSRKRALRRSSTAEDGGHILLNPSSIEEPRNDTYEGHALAPTVAFPERTSSRRYQSNDLVERKRSVTSSSIASADLDDLPLYRYDGDDSDSSTSENPESETVTPTLQQSPDSPQYWRGSTAEQDEKSSAELSRRAEQILANAKKRLNVMDQNLRGARALTAENLQRATSIQAHYPPYRNRFFEEGSTDADKLPGQSSGFSHTRGRSDVTMLATPNRPQTAMARDRIPLATDATQERRVVDSAAWTANHLRGTRSQELPRATRQPGRMSHNHSPATPLEALAEMEATPARPAQQRQSSRDSASPVALELHQQVQQLKGRISSLREKAREDSVRRRSIQPLKVSTPLTDAERKLGVPLSPTKPSADVDGGFLNPPQPGLTSRWSVDSSVKRMSTMWVLQAQEVSPVVDEDPNDSTDLHSISPVSPELEDRPSGHLREVSRSDSIPVLKPELDIESFKGSIIDSPELERNEKATADPDMVNPVPLDLSPVAHEDREDAFDYQSFYLHSGMARSGSVSDIASEDSAETERGDTWNTSEFATQAPETPETLRKIERGLHRRMISSDSVSTNASAMSFATATEGLRSGRQSPEKRTPGSSDGADSGVALPKNSLGHKRQLSHQMAAHLRTIGAAPETIAVHALIAPDKRPLGLKDKALVFMLVESLKNVSTKLQATPLDATDGRILRRRLEEARKVLDGISPLVS